MTGAYAIVQGERTLQEGPPTAIEPTRRSTLQRLIGIGLADFKPGDYTLVLRVTDQVSGPARVSSASPSRWPMNRSFMTTPHNLAKDLAQPSYAPAVVLGVLATLATRAEPQAPPTFPSGVELVRIDVVVLDKEGKPVIGLTAADFEVTEAGKPHEIASFEPIVVRSPASPATDRELPVPPPVSSSVVPLPEESRYFLIFFDDVHVTAPFAQRVRAQLIPFLEHETREGDWITIVSPLANLHFTARTAFERHQLAPIIRGLKGQFVRNPFKDPLGYYEAMRTSEYGGRAESAVPGRNSTFQASRALMAEELYALAKRRVRRTLSGLSEAIASLSGFRGRKSLIVYSEGFIKSPSMPDYDEVVELAHRARVNVYFVDPRGLGTGEPTS